MNHSTFVTQMAVNHLTPQCRTLYRHLQQRKADGVSSFEALMMFRIAALPRRIADLKDAGVDITSVRKLDETGRAYKRYYLTQHVPAEKVAA